MSNTNITAQEYLQSNRSHAYTFGGSIPALNQHGIWEVRGADHNCDLGGSHHTPLIGYFEGTFQDVFDIAKTKPSAYGWGGLEVEIKLITVVKVDAETVAKQQKLLQEKKDLEKRLKEIELLVP